MIQQNFFYKPIFCFLENATDSIFNWIKPVISLHVISLSAFKSLLNPLFLLTEVFTFLVLHLLYLVCSCVENISRMFHMLILREESQLWLSRTAFWQSKTKMNTVWTQWVELKNVCVYMCVISIFVSSSDDVRSANIIAEENGVECLVIDREWVLWHGKSSFLIRSQHQQIKSCSLCKRFLAVTSGSIGRSVDRSTKIPHSWADTVFALGGWNLAWRSSVSV